MNSTHLFTGKAEYYAASRPSYPQALMDFLQQECGMQAGVNVADIGAGSGKFSSRLLELGCNVYGVEPNADMLQKAKELLKDEKRFVPIEGTEAQTGLTTGTIDAVMAANAFHWFDGEAFREECRRILKPGGKVFLIWNWRDTSAEENKELSNVYRKYCPGYQGMSGGIERDDERIARFFKNRYETLDIDYPLYFDRNTFIARCLSSSYSLSAGDMKFESYLQALTAVFEQYAKNCVIKVSNHTLVYYGNV